LQESRSEAEAAAKDGEGMLRNQPPVPEAPRQAQVAPDQQFKDTPHSAAPSAEAPNAGQTLSAERKKVLDHYATTLALNSPDAELSDLLRHCDAKWHRSRTREEEKYWVDAETCSRRAIADVDRWKQRALDAIVPPPSSDEVTYVAQQIQEFLIEAKSFYEAFRYSDDCVSNRVANTYGWHGSMNAVREIGAYCSNAVKARFPDHSSDFFADPLFAELMADELFPCRSVHPGGQLMICNPTPEQDTKFKEERDAMDASAQIP
jgi:hypothetical protein